MELMNFRTDVKEIIDFAFQYNFLFGNAPPENLEVKVVNEIPKDSLDAGPDGKEYRTLEEGEIEFRGIREIKISEAIGIFSRDSKKNAESKRVEYLFLEGNFCDKVERRLTSELSGRELIVITSNIIDQQSLIADLIRSDMLNCAFSRIAFGKNDNFWEIVFKIYKSGGMPVGWSGKYPEGCLMVIYPGLKSI